MAFRALSRRMTACCLAALLACGAGAAAPAFAQDDLDHKLDALEPELYCAYDVLQQSGDFHDIAEVWVDPDSSQEAIDAADVVLSEAVKECASSYDWTEEAQEYAGVVAIHGSVVDAVTTELLTEGLDESEIAAIFGLLDVLEEKDADAFGDPAWMSDHAFKKKMYRALVRAGIPNEDRALANSMFVLESSVVTASTIAKWMDFKLAADADAPSVEPKASKSSKSARAAPRAPKMELAATGTGWYVAPGGYLVTNAHVVEACKMVTLKGGAELQVLDVQPEEDLALLKGVSTVNHLVIRDGRSARLAEDVLVAGYPLGGILSSGINVTVGTVSALAGMGDDERRFQFTAPVQPGNSGGPVLDTSGHVIGVVVSKLNAMNIQDQIGDIPQNVNFGIAMPNLIAFLKGNDVPFEQKVSNTPMDKVDLAELARESTVLLQCYQ